MKPSPRILELAQRLVAAGPKCGAVSASETHEITDFILSLDDEKSAVVSNAPEGGEAGFSIEHILLSVTVVHTNSIMQYDDSCARLLEIHLKEYVGVVRVDAKVQYNHTKTDIHIKGCECHHCQPPKYDCPKSPGEKPPLGLKPFQIHREERLYEIACAVSRYMSAKKPIPDEWLAEFQSLTSFIKPQTVHDTVKCDGGAF